MITVLTANPSLDRTLTVTELQPGAAQRISTVTETAGGKGLNVARVLRSHATAALVLGPLGGLIGRRVAELAAADGITAAWTRLRGVQTRTCTLVVESISGRATALNEVGPQLTARQWQRVIAARAVLAAELMLICGSLPRGVPATAAAELVERRRAAGLATWVDTSGAPLRAALAARPVLVKVNREELAAALALDEGAALDAAAAALAGDSGGTIILTDGSAGARAYRAGECWRVNAPAVTVASTIGCGDAFMAGLAAAAQHGLALPEQLRWAAAAAAAEAVSVLPGSVDGQLAAQLRTEVIVERG
jgi:1-phosphofructokinase family hexose kinase